MMRGSLSVRKTVSRGKRRVVKRQTGLPRRFAKAREPVIRLTEKQHDFLVRHIGLDPHGFCYCWKYYKGYRPLTLQVSQGRWLRLTDRTCEIIEHMSPGSWWSSLDRQVYWNLYGKVRKANGVG